MPVKLIVSVQGDEINFKMPCREFVPTASIGAGTSSMRILVKRAILKLMHFSPLGLSTQPFLCGVLIASLAKLSLIRIHWKGYTINTVCAELDILHLVGTKAGFSMGYFVRHFEGFYTRNPYNNPCLHFKAKQKTKKITHNELYSHPFLHQFLWPRDLEI